MHTTAGQTPRYVLDNFNDEKVRELVIIQTEKSQKNTKRIVYKNKRQNIVNKLD